MAKLVFAFYNEETSAKRAFSLNLKNKTMKIKTFINYTELITDEIRLEKESELPSETVQNQSEPLRNVLNKFVSGQPLPIGKQVYYDGEDNFDAIDPTLDPSFDLSDVSEFKRELELKELEKAETARAKANEDKRRADEEVKAIADSAKLAQNQVVTPVKDTTD